MNQQKKFRFRAFVSLLTAFSFILLTVTGIILYITPPGRIANWTNWTVWGLSKHQWGALHICLAALFLIASALHTWLNFKTLTSYFLSKAKAASAFRLEWLLAMVLCGGVVWGSLMPFIPFSSLLDLNERIKFSWDKPQQQPPIPHAEILTIAELAQKSNIELETMLQNLDAAGIKATSSDVFGDIAEQQNMSPNKLFTISTGREPIPADKGGGQHQQGSGFGQQTLQRACQAAEVDIQKVITALNAAGIKAQPDQTIRQIADENGIHPSDIRPYLK